MLHRPTVAIMQWRNEISAHTEGMNVLVWHGASRVSNPKELEKYDVVSSSFKILCAFVSILMQPRYLLPTLSWRVASGSSRAVSSGRGSL